MCSISQRNKSPAIRPQQWMACQIKNIYAGEGPVSKSSISKQSQTDKQCVNHKALNLGYNRAN